MKSSSEQSSNFWKHRTQADADASKVSAFVILLFVIIRLFGFLSLVVISILQYIENFLHISIALAMFVISELSISGFVGIVY